MDNETLKKEVERLAQAAGGENWCPNGGWQYPFEFSKDVKARTYTSVQERLHPWRKNMLIKNLDKIYEGKYNQLSVLDLGSGEGAMSLALWNKGVRDITCVEVREVNVEKMKFVFNHFGVEANIHQTSIGDFLKTNTKKYDIVIFMGILYHLLNPFDIIKQLSEITNDSIVMETVVAKVDTLEFGNRDRYSAEKEGFFIRVDTTESQTAGLSNLEMWATVGALDMLMEEYSFGKINHWEFDNDAPIEYLNKERIIGLSRKK